MTKSPSWMDTSKSHITKNNKISQDLNPKRNENTILYSTKIEYPSFHDSRHFHQMRI